MTDRELAAYLHGQVGHDLDLDLEELEAAVEWLHEDPVFRAARAQDTAHAACIHAAHLRKRSQNLRAAGATRRLVGGCTRASGRKPSLRRL